MEFENQRAFAAYTEIDVVPSATQDSDSSSTAQACDGLIVPVILSGGGGSRLWPYSTHQRPKQFLPLVGSKTLFREALDRVRGRERFAAPVVVASALHRKLCEAELKDEGDSARLILEPCARNTAAAIGMAAAAACVEHGEDALLLVMPSDHVIEDVAAFHEAISVGEAAARAGRLVTFGVRPASPDTGYGYLQMGEELAGAPGVMEVARFVEKPPIEAAKAMVAGGDHLWNAGIFLFRAGTLLEELWTFAPLIGKSAQRAVMAGETDGICIIPALDALADCPSESIDYAVMEHSSRIAMVPMSPGWSDLGSWDSLAALVSGGATGGPVTLIDCENCYIRSDGLQVAALGVSDLIIVASGERLLVLPRGRSQEVKRLLSAMEAMAA